MTNIISKDERGKFKSQGKGIGHNKKPIPVVYPPDIDALLRSLPNRSDYIREAVMDKLRKDGLIA